MKALLSCVLILIFSYNGFSQTFDEYKKNKQTEFNKKLQEFDEYYKQKDNEFQKYLAEKWHEFDVYAGVKVYEEPKPKEIPEYKPQPQRKPLKITPKIPKKKSQLPLVEPDKTIMQRERGNDIVMPEPDKEKHPDEIPDIIKPEASFLFYGVDIFADYTNFICPVSPSSFSGSAFASWWEKASGNNYQNLIKQLIKSKNNLQLNDWGYYKLIEEITNKITNNINQKILLQWFFMVKSGYDVRLAFNSNELSLFIPVKQQLYSKPFIELNGKNYYEFYSFKSDKVKMYIKANQNAQKVLDFDLNIPLKLGNKYEHRETDFRLNLKDYYFGLNYNPYWTDFFADYPQGDLKIYFDAAVSGEFKNSIFAELKPAVTGLSKRDAVNFLLRYVQESFKYKTDTEQFGYEKFFFPEETLFYPYSDCEDRAVYFAWLVRNLLNMEVVGLKYSGHVATAVNIPGQQKGDYLMFEGKKFIVADPTYIGAPAGLTMSKYVNEKPEIINFK